MIENNNPLPEFRESDFIKASASEPDGAGCVRIAARDGKVAVYSDRRPFPGSAGVMSFDTDEWAIFAAAMKAGEFDHLIDGV